MNISYLSTIVFDMNRGSLFRGERGGRESFADAIRGDSSKYPIYIVEEDKDDEDFDSMQEVYGAKACTDTTGQHQWPFMDIKEETYRMLGEPWCRALIIKVLGKSVTFKLLEQRVMELWK